MYEVAHSRVSAAVAFLRLRIDEYRWAARNAALRHPNVVRALAGSLALGAVLTGWFMYQVLAGLPGKAELRELSEAAEGTILYDVHNRLVSSIPTQYRIEVPLDRMSASLRDAIVAVEDVRFFDHDGIDGIRVIGAILTDLREGRAAEGASTITQQLARVSFLTRDKTLRRKVREAILAQRIEHLYSKDEILEIYLNKVYFGDGLYGAEAAARGYFGKPAAALTLGEAAMLAGIVKSPSVANPSVSVERAIDRRNVVLKLMRQHGYIDREAYQSAVIEKVRLRDNLRHEEPSGVHFKETVRRQLIDLFGKEMVYKGRLRVYTTIDPDMQRAAEAAVAETLAEIEARIPDRHGEPLEGALLAMDPANGEVRAVVGGRDISGVGLNRALQSRRQSGSAFKPFVYAAALESGYSPASLIDRLNQPVDSYEGAWLPEDEHSSAASMTMRAALRTSSNRAAVRTLENIGITRAVSYLQHLGLGAVPNVPSLALGSGEVTLASMTAAYATFARGGIVREPVFIRRAEDQDGRVLFQGDAKPRRAVSESTAFLMATMLADVVDAGTANSARRLGFALPAAGKTGTTNDFVDAWFVGFTPKLGAGVWVGFDRPRTIVRNGFAGQIAVPMWARFMKAATRGDGEVWLEPPPDVVEVAVCRRSGNLPGAGCRHAASMSANGEITYKSMVYRDYFVRGREPYRVCTSHATDYQPYPEPVFAATAFDAVSPESAITPDAPAAVPVLSVPAAPPEPRPVTPVIIDEDPALLLPPAAPPEPAPSGP